MNIRPFAIIIILISATIIIGCSKKAGMIKQEVSVSDEQLLPKGSRLEAKIESEIKSDAQIGSDHREPSLVEEFSKFDDIYFNLDRYQIEKEYKDTLVKMAAWLLKNKDVKIIIEGYTDERGTNEYNLALGDRRAKSVRDYLIYLGVDLNRIRIISYGEEKPLCAESKENCWFKNRKAHFDID